MHRISNQRKLKEIADANNISLASANEIVRSQWELVKQIINSCDIEKEYFPIIRIKHLGKFVITERRKFSLKKKRNDMC